MKEQAKNILIAVIASGMFSTLISWMYNSQNSVTGRYNDIIESYEHVVDDLKEELQECKSIARELDQLKLDVKLIQLSSQDSPDAEWIKSTDLRMLWMNKAYEQTWLIPYGLSQNDYINKQDTSIWGMEIGMMYMKNDRWVLENEAVWRGIEYVDHPPYGKRILLVTKWPIEFDGKVIGIRGRAVEQDLWK